MLATKAFLNTPAPLDNKDREAFEDQRFKNGAPTIALEIFIDVVLVSAVGDRATLATFYQLMESYGLVVYDKVINGKQVASSQLLETLRQRELQAKEAWDDDSFQFWETINKEGRYSVCREDVGAAYKNAKKLKIPWQNLGSEFIWLNCLFSNNSKSMEAKRNLKESLPIEPQNLSLRYKPGKSFQQEKWEAIPKVKHKYWKHRDTLTIIEFAFILKGKEPQPKVTQRSVINLYPLDFCEFLAELLTLSDSSWKIGSLIVVNPAAPYCEEWAETPEFKRTELIKWAVSKEIEVPEWLNSQQDTQIRTKPSGTETTQNTPTSKPWLIADPKDPAPIHNWYIPARYFARQLIRETPLLLTNRSLLVSKIATSLSKVGINKRGNKKPFNPDTIKKALSNVDFS